MPSDFRRKTLLYFGSQIKNKKKLDKLLYQIEIQRNEKIDG